MRNGFKALALSGLVAILAGCSSPKVSTHCPSRSKLPPVSYSSTNDFSLPVLQCNTPSAVSEMRITSFSNTNLSYVNQTLNLYGEENHLSTNSFPLLKELSFMHFPFTNAFRSKNPMAKTVTWEPKDFYMIPTQVTNFNGNIAHEVPLSSQGKYANKSIIHRAAPTSQLGIITSTQDAEEFNHKINIIQGVPFYIIEVENSALNTIGKGNQYFIPVRDTTIKTDQNNGSQIFFSKDGIYRSQAFHKDSIAERAKTFTLSTNSVNSGVYSAASSPQ